MSSVFSNNHNSFNTTIVSPTVAGDRSDILAWLSPLDPRLRHQDIRDRRVENVGEWLLETEEFINWFAGSGGDESAKGVLFCYGDPGVGKTFISSLVIDSLCAQAGGRDATVACYYFDFAAKKAQTPTSMLGTLLRQLVFGLEETPEEISRAYLGRKNSIGGQGPQFSDIVKMMQATSSKKPTFICIDALDECAAGYRVKLLDSLNKILERSPGTRVFITGRPHIRPEVGRCLAERTTSVRISPKRDDVIKYLHTRMHEDTTPEAMDSSLEADILRKIPEDVSEIFLLVALNIDAILQETTIHRRRQKLGAMTDGLGLEDVYGTTINRIRGQGGEKARLGMATLMWISHSERPLKTDELCHALAVEIGSENLNTSNVPSIGTLLTCCQGLVAVDKEASAVRLIHFTLQEYIRAHPELFGRAHSTIAETCLSYLNSQKIKPLSTGPSPDPRGTPFLEYSSLHWGTHAKRDLSDRAKFLALKLFDGYADHISTKILLQAQRRYSIFCDFGISSLFTGLHCASFFGVVELVAGLIEVEGCDINQKDCVGNAPLMWAARNGHEGVVKILLGRDDVNLEELDRFGQTPLCSASENGHAGVVKTLLERGDVDPNKPDKYGRAPLSRAAWNGQERVVKILLEQDGANPDKQDSLGRTLLWWAAWNGHEGVMKILLERDGVNPDKPDKFGQTPLCAAASDGCDGVVKILLERDDVNPNKLDNDGQTPLWCAAKNGHAGVVKTLLERGDVDPNKPDKYGWAPLSRAAWNGHEGVVKILLEQDGANPNKPDEVGQTPLCKAASDGREGLVKMLLERDDVNPNQPDNDDQTPLLCAVQKGHEGVVKILLDRDDINPNQPDNYGQTPLSHAAFNGHERVVKILLERDDINPDKQDSLGQTPLCAAAFYGHGGVVKILLERDDVNPDKPDKLGQTPLFKAAFYGHEGVVKILLERDDVNPNKPDNAGRTPLLLASQLRHAGVVALLQPRVLPV